MTWSEAARRAALLARQLHKKPKLTLVRKGSTGHAVTKATLALRTYKPSTAAKQALADAGEARVAKMIGGARTADNLPVDTTVHGSDGRYHGVEVKTVSDNGNAKITMHPESLARKIKWGKSNHASLHTVVVDLRGKEPVVLYRKGVGSFRLHTLTPVRTGAELKRLMGLT